MDGESSIPIDYFPLDDGSGTSYDDYDVFEEIEEGTIQQILQNSKK